MVGLDLGLPTASVHAVKGNRERCSKQDKNRIVKEIYAMEVETKRQGDTLIAMTDGRIDGANAREFQTALDAAIDANECAVVLDMERLSYISSAGLRVILLTAKALQGRNRKFAICSLSESIREVFEISGFDKIIPIHASEVEALAAFKE